jgi:hypothetical protein
MQTTDKITKIKTENEMIMMTMKMSSFIVIDMEPRIRLVSLNLNSVVAALLSQIYT